MKGEKKQKYKHPNPKTENQRLTHRTNTPIVLIFGSSPSLKSKENMCADVHDTDLISCCGSSLNYMRSQSGSVKEYNSNAAETHRYLLKIHWVWILKRVSFGSFTLGEPSLSTKPVLKMTDVLMGHRRWRAFLKLKKKKLNPQPFLNWPVILPIL